MHAMTAFRAFDIRWVWQQEIDEAFGRHLWYVFWLHLLEKFPNPRILIAADVRLANNILVDEVLKWMKSAGIQAVEVFGRDPEKYPEYTYGVCSTSIMYHLWLGEADCTMIFSASHNAGEYVWIKIVDREGKYFKTVDLRKMYESTEKIEIWSELPSISSHETEKLHTLFDDMSERFSSLSKLPSITIDYSNGAGVHYERDFLWTLWWENFHHLFDTPDSDFSNHESDTSRFANYDKLIAKIQSNGSDFWFMFDGDVDRIGLCLPDGRVVTGDIILAIIVKQLLEGGKADELWSREIFQEVFCSRVVRDITKKYWGNLHIVPVWRWKFVDEVIEKNWLIAGETSAHILFKEYGTIEVPLLALYYIMKELESFWSAIEMIDAYMPYVRGQIVHFVHDEKDMVIEEFKKRYADYEQNLTDGVRIEWPDRWLTVRKSGTEPILKVWLEWETQAIYDTILGDIRSVMQELWAHEEQ